MAEQKQKPEPFTQKSIVDPTVAPERQFPKLSVTEASRLKELELKNQTGQLTADLQSEFSRLQQKAVGQ